jgi:fructan beta-fructosidase
VSFNFRTAGLIFAALGVWGITAPQSKGLDRFEEPYRPQYHFSPEKGWIGDPDGLIHYNGRFSMFWWGKATSTDLVHYTQDSALVMTGDAGNARYFSGSVVVDKRNTAGFGVNAQVAVYTLFDPLTKRQAQGISYSTDGQEFEFFHANPVLDIGSTEFRDPTVFWHAPTSTWIMAVALARDRKIQFYSSPDLKAWTLRSEFSASSVGREVWECPDLIELPVDGDASRKKWVLVISVDWSHEEYFIGDFDGTRFVESKSMRDSRSASGAHYVDLGLDFYASRTFRDYDDTLTRTTSLGWVSTWAYANQVPSSWGKGFWSIPRDLALKSYPEGVRLLQSPVDGLKSLRQQPVAFVTPLTPGTQVLPKFRPKRNVYEIDATFGTDVPNLFGFDLCVGNGHRVAIRYDSQSQILTIDRTNSSDVPIPGFARRASAPVAPLNNRLRLHLYVDESSIEVFANDGMEVFTLLTYAGDAQTAIELFAEHPGTVMQFEGWRLKSIWHETSKRRGSDRS